ncbi:MAG: hypothetical protein IH958_02070 [Chloroflexi bacterium]|nr:hypothetical protein [Chloroflexota bacterium]
MGEDLAAHTTAETKKFAFASPAWVDFARTVLEELVADHGEAGRSFSVCEVFTGAPPDVAGSGATTVAWHFRIVDKTVTVGEGEIIDADMNVRVDYQSVLPMARLVYTPEILAQLERDAPQAADGSTGDRSNMPPYLVELHNRLAVATQ